MKLSTAIACVAVISGICFSQATYAKSSIAELHAEQAALQKEHAEKMQALHDAHVKEQAEEQAKEQAKQVQQK